MKKTITITLDRNDIINLIADKLGKPVDPDSIRWHMKETGDVDRGNYRVELKSLDIVTEEQ